MLKRKVVKIEDLRLAAARRYLMAISLKCRPTVTDHYRRLFDATESVTLALHDGKTKAARRAARG